MQTQQKHVLLIEDCPGDVFLLEQMLKDTKNHNITITQVPRLVDAFDKLGTEHFDAIILDLNLPDIDGVASIAALSAKLPEVPIIVYSGQENTRLKLNALLCGAANYLVKGRETGASIEKAIMTSRVASKREPKAKKAKAEAPVGA